MKLLRNLFCPGRVRRADEEFRANADTLAWLTLRLIPNPERLQQLKPRFDALFRLQEQLLDVMRSTLTDRTRNRFDSDCHRHDLLGAALETFGYRW